MLSNVLRLLRVDFIKRFWFQSITHEKDSKKKYRNLSITLVFGLVVLILAGYSFGLSYGLGMLKISYVTPGYALTISALVTLFFTFTKTNGVLFATKDYDMLLSLPIKIQAVITAKFLSMYLNNLAFTAVVMLPMAIGYVCWNPVTLMGTVSWILITLFAPLLPMTIAAIVGALIAAISSGSKHQPIFQLLATVLLIVGIMVGSFYLNNAAKNDEAALKSLLTDIGATLSRTLHRIYPLSTWFDKAVNNGEIGFLFLILIVSLFIFTVFVLFVAKYYTRINTALLSHHTTSNYKLGKQKSHSICMTIAKKEAKHFFSSSVYLLNMGIGLLFALIVSVASLFIGIDKILNSMNINGLDTILPMIPVFIPFLIAMLVNMCNTSAVTLSLEGKQLWIVKSLPLSGKMLMQGKMLFNILLVLPVSLLCSVLFMINLHVSVTMGVVYIVCSVVSVLFSTVLGTLINLHFPNYTWENEVEVVKQGMASMLSILGGMLGYLALGIAATFLSSYVAPEVVILVICGILTIIGGILYIRITRYIIVKE